MHNKRVGIGLITVSIALLLTIAIPTQDIIRDGPSPLPSVLATGTGTEGSLSEDDASGTAPLFVTIFGPKNSTYTATDLANVGDIQGDGCDDLMVGTSMDHHEYLPIDPTMPNYIISGNSERSFTSSDFERISVFNGTWSNSIWEPNIYKTLITSDVNGDGHPDVMEFIGDTLLVVFGRDSGFSDEIDQRIRIGESTVPPGAELMQHVEGIGDVNGDGYDDVMIGIGARFDGEGGMDYDPSNHPPNRWKIYYGSSDGLHDAPGWTKTLEWAPGRSYAPSGRSDFNGDGLPEPFITGWPVGPVVLTSDDGVPMNFTDIATGYMVDDFQNGTIAGTQRHAPVNLNGDRYDDMLMNFLWDSYRVQYPWGARERLYFFNGSPSGIAWPPERGWIDLSDTDLRAHDRCDLLVCDVNGDGYDDIVLLTYETISPDIVPAIFPYSGCHVNITLRLHLNKGDGFSAREDWKRTISTGGRWPTQATVGDFDGDGYDDIALGMIGNEEYVTRLDGPVEFGTPGSVVLIFGKGILDILRPVTLFGGPVLYAGYKAYDFKVNLNPYKDIGISRSATLTLDPGGADVTLSYNGTLAGNPFTIASDRGHFVSLASQTSDSEIDHLNSTAWLHFRVLFGWNWPHEDLCDAVLRLSSKDEQDAPTFLIRHLFSVEKDLDFLGGLAVSGEWQGPVGDGGWVRAGEDVVVSGPVIVYEGTKDVYPPDGTCSISIFDGELPCATVPVHAGAIVNLTFMADDAMDIEHALSLRLVDLPAGANQTYLPSFTLNVDGEPPTFRDPIPAADEWHCRRMATVVITVDDGRTSGVVSSSLEYSYSTRGPRGFGPWTSANVSTTPDGGVVYGTVEMEFAEGDGNLVRWRARDRVGNTAVSADMRVRIDTINVTFNDPEPESEDWMTSLDVICGVTIEDMDGAGIDASTVQYRASSDHLWHYRDWVDWDEGTAGDQLRIHALTKVGLRETDSNYVQWRAMDIAGNGYTTSPHYRVRVDVSPIVFIDPRPTPDEPQNRTEVTFWLTVSDGPGGSGVDLGTIRYRVITNWTDGDTDDGIASPWSPAGMAGQQGELRFSLVIHLAPGAVNAVQFGGFDVAGNGPALSAMYRITLDLSPPEFMDVYPSPSDRQTSERVRVTFTITDPSSGVDPQRVWYRYGTAGRASLGEWHRIEGSSFEGTFSSCVVIDLSKGDLNVIQLRAWDMAGNEGTSNLTTIWVNRDPSAVIRLPAKDSDYDDKERIPFSAIGSLDADGDALDYTWAVNGTMELVLHGLNASALLPAGAYNLTLTVRDEYGATATASSGFIVQVSPSPKIRSEDSSAAWRIVLVLVLIGAVMGSIAYASRRRAG